MIAQVIADATAEFGGDPYQINNGSCYEWAEFILERLHDENHQVQLWEVPFGMGETTHAFLRIDGKFYDAEAPNGVMDHMNLPIFQKIFAQTKTRQPVWLIDYNQGMVEENRRDITHEMLVRYDEENGTNNSGQFPHNGSPTE